ncbi:PREDICTED: phytolongin Phyl2.2 [Camelina sativa]|uniref:Phytolongin Phyl2.2 n=1 Tax=Camelina sativa TaxID=90675 RepID=A0ABM0USA7_CAMSA|nr:PREDICTED: phytolongin Phyl2.2 [Camelina sativa]
MITNPSLLSYTCIAKGTIVLAEFISKEEPGIEAVALRCIENTPPHHSMFSHTVRKKTYTFAIDDDSFVYFAILDETMEKSESFWVLNRLRSVMEDLIRLGGSDAETVVNNPVSLCLQSKLDPVFAEIVGGGFGCVDVDLELDMDLVGSPRSVARESRNPSIDSSKGRRAALMPLLGKPLKALKKKKRLLHNHNEAKGGEDDSCGSMEEISEKKVDLCGNGNNGVLRKEVRNGLFSDHHHRQKAKQIWKKHVWVVLMFDFCICAILFGIWLWICEGFQCIQG